MTDSPSPADPGPVDPDVELASAHLDGEAGPDERARVEDPAVAEHRSTFDRIAAQVRDVPPPPAGLLDDHVARALAAFDDEGRVVPLRHAGGSKPWWQRIPLGAVAAVLVIVALVGIANLADQGGDDDTATAAFDTSDDSGDEGDSAGGAAATEETMADAAEESTALESEAGFDAAGAPVAYADLDELAAGLRDELAAAARAGSAPDDDAADPTTTAGPSADTEGLDGEADRCGAVEQLGIDPGAVVLVRSVVVADDPVTVVVHDAEDGRRLTVVDDASCAVVLDRIL